MNEAGLVLISGRPPESDSPVAALTQQAEAPAHGLPESCRIPNQHGNLDGVHPPMEAVCGN